MWAVTMRSASALPGGAAALAALAFANMASVLPNHFSVRYCSSASCPPWWCGAIAYSARVRASSSGRSTCWPRAISTRTARGLGSVGSLSIASRVISSASSSAARNAWRLRGSQSGPRSSQARRTASMALSACAFGSVGRAPQPRLEPPAAAQAVDRQGGDPGVAQRRGRPRPRAGRPPVATRRGRRRRGRPSGPRRPAPPSGTTNSPGGGSSRPIGSRVATRTTSRVVGPAVSATAPTTRNQVEPQARPVERCSAPVTSRCTAAPSPTRPPR